MLQDQYHDALDVRSRADPATLVGKSISVYIKLLFLVMMRLIIINEYHELGDDAQEIDTGIQDRILLSDHTDSDKQSTPWWLGGSLMGMGYKTEVLAWYT